MLIEDLDGFSSRNLYIVALGFVFGPKSCVEDVVVVPESMLERYRRGDYEWKVIEAEQLPQTCKSDIHKAVIEMCARYDKVPLSSNPVIVNMQHQERVKVANEIAEKLILRPYVNSVHLTGSTALGSDRIDSDVDLLVVLGYCPGNNGHREMDELGKGYPCPVDFFCIQEKDFLRAQNLGYKLFKDNGLIFSK